MRKKNKAGFTLLELLLAVTIFSIVAVALYASFNAGIRILRRSEEVMSYHQDLRIVMDELSLDLHNSLLAEIYSETEKFETAGAEGGEEEHVYFFTGERKTFSFVTLRDTYTEKGLERNICNVTYSLKGGESGGLVRSLQYQSTGFASNDSGEDTLLTGIEDLEVTYSYAAEDEDEPPVWLDYWDQEEKIPLGVKVKFKLKGLGRMREFAKTVYIDVGALGTLEEDPLGPSYEVGR
jgi:type II secretion system protein J